MSFLFFDCHKRADDFTIGAPVPWEMLSAKSLG